MLVRKCPAILFAVLASMITSTSWSADSAKGHEAYSIGDYQTALMEWQALAEEGDVDSQFGMGLLNANGFGVPLNDDQALKWYTLAADQGHAQAQCNLAVMHANGWGVPQSDEVAFKWYGLAADQGIVEAQTSLAKMYARGRGTAEDSVNAHKWYVIAVELGDSGAAYKRDEIASKMSEIELSEANQLANDWMENHRNLQANH